MPEAGETIAFKNHFKKLKAPFVIYADFECLTVPIDVKSKPTKAKTTSYQNHRPCGFMINVVNAITGSSEPVLRVSLKVLLIENHESRFYNDTF